MTTQHKSSWIFALGLFIGLTLAPILFYGLTACDGSPSHYFSNPTDSTEVRIDCDAPPCDSNWIPPGKRDSTK